MDLRWDIQCFVGLLFDSHHLIHYNDMDFTSLLNLIQKLITGVNSINKG